MENSNQTNWTLDPAHSEITFKVKHLMISNVSGEFTDFAAIIDGEDFKDSKVNVVIKAASISTGNTDRDNHLKSADFLDVENSETITFQSNSFKPKGDDEYLLKGILTIKGVAKEIQLNVEFGGISKDPWGNEKAGFSVNGKINRKDWNLNWNAALETGGVLVGDDIKIQAEVQFTKN